MNKLTLDDLEPAGKRVLVRVDYNLPMRDGEITDDSRLVASIPTVRRLVEAGAKVVLMSHLGRPKGQPDPAYSLAPVAQRLAKLLGQEVHFTDDCVGRGPLEASEKLEAGQVLLLENLRFHPEEEASDPAFSKQLAQLGDLYLNDAFGAAHRDHASTAGVTRFFPQAAAGPLLERELRYLIRAVENPEHPYVVVLGGAKVSGKIDVLQNLMPLVDSILIGGGMIYTFYKARGIEIGDSLVESDREQMAADLLAESEKTGSKLVLPVDSVVSGAADGSEPAEVTAGEAIPPGMMGVDLGPRSVDRIKARLAGARTVVWNGPLGIFEVPAFSRGTEAVAREIAGMTGRGATTIVGGGDSVAAIHRLGLENKDFSHVSTGGGAFLEFLEGKELPGVAALADRKGS